MFASVTTKDGKEIYINCQLIKMICRNGDNSEVWYQDGTFIEFACKPLSIINSVRNWHDLPPYIDMEEHLENARKWREETEADKQR